MYIMARTTITAGARGLTLLAVASVLGGCAMKADVRDLQDEIRSLASRQDSLISELRAQTLSTQDTLRTQTNQMFDFRGDINQSIRQLLQGMARLEALAGENQRGIAQVRDQLANQRRGGAPPQVTLTDSTAPPSTGSEQLLPGGTGSTGSADDVWQAATRQLDRGSFSAATMAFQQFLTDHPSDPRAATAHFNMADILERQGRPEDALEAFQRIPALYPADDQVPNAMYRSALLQRKLGNTNEAKAILQRILNSYPGAPVVVLVRDLLDQIG